MAHRRVRTRRRLRLGLVLWMEDVGDGAEIVETEHVVRIRKLADIGNCRYAGNGDATKRRGSRSLDQTD